MLSDFLSRYFQYHYSLEPSSTNISNNKTASRQELQRKVQSLEQMTQELYKISTEKLLDTLNGKT